MKTKITKSLIEKSEPAEKDYLIWDNVITGLFLRVYASGKKVFFGQFRLKNGKMRKAKIGEYPTIVIDEARETFREWIRIASSGHDPIEEIKALSRRIDTKQKNIHTIEELHDRYMNEYALLFKKPSSCRNDKGYWSKHILPFFKGRIVSEISPSDISELRMNIASKINRQGKQMKTTANRALEVLAKAFSLAEDWKWIPNGSNPCSRRQKFKEVFRKRYLSPKEAVQLGKVLQEYLASGGTKRKIARLILLLINTGARKNEFMHGMWSWVDWERAVYCIPDSKSNEPQEIQLSEVALSILREMYEERKDPDHPYIFEGHIHRRPLQDEGVHWDCIRKKAGLINFHMHDLRHSYASFVAAATGSLFMVASLLRHEDEKSAKRYAHVLNAPLLQAVNATSDIISQVMSSEVSEAVDFYLVRQPTNH